VTFTLTDRLGLPQWGQGSDGPSRVQLNAAFLAVNNKVAYDDGTAGASALPSSDVVNGRYAQVVDGAHRRLYRRGAGAWSQVGGNSWAEPTHHRTDGTHAVTSAARTISHTSFGTTPVTENWDGSSTRQGRQGIGDLNPGNPGALHVGDTASAVDLAVRGRIYARTTADGQRGVVASAHGSGAGHLFAAIDSGGSVPWYVDAQGRLRSQAPAAYGAASLTAGVPLASAPGGSDVTAADLYAGASKAALRIFRALGDGTAIGSFRQDAIALGRASWAGATIDLTAPTIRLNGPVTVNGELILAGGAISSDNLPDDLTLLSLHTGTLNATSSSVLAGVTATSLASTGKVSGTVLAATSMLKLPTGAPAAVGGEGAGQVRLGDIWQVEVYDGSNWLHGARIGRRSGRVHSWQQTGYTLNNNTPMAVTGWGVVQAGSIATLSSGNLKLNRPGLWSLRWSSFVDAGVSGYVQAQAETLDNSNLFSGMPYLVKTETRQITIGVAGSGNSEVLLTWTGYVDATMAAKSIRFVVFQANDTGASTNATGAVMTAEFLSD
jgi:hypothetical protein